MSIASFYDRSFEEFGDTHQAVGWFTENTQQIRFLMLSLLTDWSKVSVLDVGCATGEFYTYLKARYPDVKYEGIDFSVKMLEAARRKFPDTSFIQADFMTEKFKKTYDYVVASGVFNHREQAPLMESAIKKMFALARKGVAFNALSSFTPEHQQDRKTFHYYDPLQIIRFSLTLTRFVEFKQSYLPNDFTVYLYR